jgi:hypothetical protein
VLSTESIVNPETGEVGHKVLNPSGEVSLIYTKTGLQLDFVKADGKADTIQIYVEFPEKPEAANEQQSIRNGIMESVLSSRGKILLGQMLKQISLNANKAGSALILLIDNSRVVGFRKDHVKMEDVKLLVPGQPSMSLAQILFNAVGPSAEAQAEAIMAKKYPKNPIGFTDGLPAAPIGGPRGPAIMCEAMFNAAN